MQKYVEENIAFICEEDILRLAEKELPINNVVKRVNKEAFGAWVSHNKKICINYTYHDEENKLQCMVLFLPKKLTYNKFAHIIFCFSMAVSDINKNNIIDTHNTYCVHLRSVFEREGFSTFTQEEREKLKTLDTHGILISNEPIITLPTINKKKFYTEFFKEVDRENLSNEDKVYLMYDFHTDLTKIGYSKNPKVREHTLQSEKPDIILLAFWSANKQIEKIVHKKYANKRLRGEWFNLDFRDYKEIKEYMESYQSQI